jgi:hypothetical protein
VRARNSTDTERGQPLMIRQLGFLPFPLAIQLRVGVGGRGMRVVLPALPVEVDRRVPRIIGGRRLARILPLKALETGPRLEHRAVNREVLIGQQAGRLRLRTDRVEERRCDIALEEAVAILGERRRRPNRFVRNSSGP